MRSINTIDSIVGNKENAHFYAFSERLVMIIDLRSIQITICLIKRALN